MATALVVGTVIGSGVFKKPQVIALNVPYFGLVAIVWILGGLLALLGGLALAEVGVLFPRSGGNYVFLREGFGRLPAFLYGWVEFWISRSASLAALATIFTESLYNLIKPTSVGAGNTLSDLDFWLQRWLTVALLLGLALINVLGVRWGGVLQLLVTLVKAGSLLAILALPFVARAFAPPEIDVPSPNTQNFQPGWPDAWDQVRFGGLGTALLGVLWAYHGWMNSVLVAEEIKTPQRNIPLSLLGGTLIVIALYLGANFAYYLIMPGTEIATIRDTPVATVFSKHLLGPMGAAVASGMIMCSVFGALNGNLLVGPRVLFALSSDGLAPRPLATVHPRFRTPSLAILALASWSSLLILGSATLVTADFLPKDKPIFDVMTDYALFGAIIFETMAVATIFPLRLRLPEADRPYRCPGYPFVPALYVLILGTVLFNMFFKQTMEAAIGLGFIALGVGVYFVIDRNHHPPLTV
jgi:amino acid transporter